MLHLMAEPNHQHHPISEMSIALHLLTPPNKQIFWSIVTLVVWNVSKLSLSRLQPLWLKPHNPDQAIPPTLYLTMVHSHYIIMMVLLTPLSWNTTDKAVGNWTSESCLLLSDPTCWAFVEAVLILGNMLQKHSLHEQFLISSKHSTYWAIFQYLLNCLIKHSNLFKEGVNNILIRSSVK